MLEIIPMQITTALENIRFFAYHGMYPEEKIKGAEFIVDVWVSGEVTDETEFRKLEELVNYEQIYSILTDEMDKPRDFIEDLAKTILDRVFSLLTQKDFQVKVKITKPNPAGLFGSGAASVMLSKN